MNAAQRLAQDHLHGFLAALGAAGIAPGPQKQVDFLRAVALTAPPTPRALSFTARATLVQRVEDLDAFAAIFAEWFGERERAVRPPARPRTQGAPEPAARRAGDHDPPETFAVREGEGRRASPHEVTTDAGFAACSPEQAELLAALRRDLRDRLPGTRARRRVPARRAATLDLRRVARSASRTGGEVTRLCWRDRPTRPRRVLMLVDVSGSLRATSPDALRVAHAVLREVPSSDAYTFGTRLTHVGPALRARDVDVALERVAQDVADVNGGTRIGDALEAFLADGRRVSAARDAIVVVVSDGLERGDPGAMARGVERIARLAHRLVWWSPLACDPAYRPVTRGMAAIVDHLDDLVGVRDLAGARLAVERLALLELDRGRAPRATAAPGRGRDGAR